MDYTRQDIEALLKRPFHEDDIHWRVSRAKKPDAIYVLAYIDSRAIMDRLDEVFGVFGWQDEYSEVMNGGFQCAIMCKHGDTWIKKTDGAPNTQVEAIKGGYSDALKRCAVKWGMGRYLYNLTENKVSALPNGKYGKYSVKINGNWYNWNPPKLPDWAIQKPQLTPESDNWEDVVNVIKGGDASLEQLKSKYFLIPSHEELILKEVE